MPKKLETNQLYEDVDFRYTYQEVKSNIINYVKELGKYGRNMALCIPIFLLEMYKTFNGQEQTMINVCQNLAFFRNNNLRGKGVTILKME